MKTWIRRTLIALGVTTLLAGGLSACSHGPGWHRGAGPMTEADVQQMRTRIVERAGTKLNLDAAQKAKLDTLADALQAQRAALAAGPGGTMRGELKGLIAGERFDRSGAQALLDRKTGAVRDKAPAVLQAFGDFYDSLKPEQQQQLREMLDRGRRWGRG